MLLVAGVSLILTVSEQQPGAAIVERKPGLMDEMRKDVTDEMMGWMPQDERVYDLVWGTVYVLMIVACSGFAGVYFERVLKSTKSVSLWSRNFQLSLYSVLFGFANILLTHPSHLVSGQFFEGFSAFTWLTIQLGAFGGLLVAVVVQHTDTIVKGFASSAGVVTTTLLSSLLFGTHLSFQFSMAVLVVVIASLNYAEPDSVL